MLKVKNLSKIKNNQVCFSFISESTVSEIADLMDIKDIGAVPILDLEKTLIGILSERDILMEERRTFCSILQTFLPPFL